MLYFCKALDKRTIRTATEDEAKLIIDRICTDVEIVDYQLKQALAFAESVVDTYDWESFDPETRVLFKTLHEGLMQAATGLFTTKINFEDE